MADTEKKNQEQTANAATPQTTAEQIQNNPRPCPKDCRKCTMAQQICCAALLSFQSFEVMNGIIQRLDIQSQRISELESRISVIQSSETELAAPALIQGELFTNS